MSFINRADNATDDFWINQLAKELNKTSVNSKEKDDSIFSQLNQIINKKSKYSSVEDIVNDMKHRSGYSSYMSKQSQKEETKKTAKTASEEIALFKQYPNVKQTIINCITDNNGTLSVPSILERVKSIHNNEVNNEGLWNDDALIKFISKTNLQEKSKETTPVTNLGKNPDLSEEDQQLNFDFLSGMFGK